MSDDNVIKARSKVLLVEDNLMNRVLVKEVLLLRGFDVIEATTGAEAIKALASVVMPDLILMDLHLPEMDGVTAMRIIKNDERYAVIPILALTASAMKGEEENIMDMGFDGYIPKPIDVRNLAVTINGFLKDKDG